MCLELMITAIVKHLKEELDNSNLESFNLVGKFLITTLVLVKIPNL